MRFYTFFIILIQQGENGEECGVECNGVGGKERKGKGERRRKRMKNDLMKVDCVLCSGKLHYRYC